MGYQLRAFIAGRGTFDEMKQRGKRVALAQLNNDLDLLLNDKYLHQALNIEDSQTEANELAGWSLTPHLVDFFREKSHKTPIAYIWSEYFGGIGSQKAIVWQNSVQVLKKQTEEGAGSISLGPINDALRLLGVVANVNQDEFETAGLHRHRKMEYWFEEGTGINWKKYGLDA